MGIENKYRKDESCLFKKGGVLNKKDKWKLVGEEGERERQK
jgi:hypothetical protein